MEIIITDWALSSYLKLKHGGVFTEEEYRKVLRPDTLLLREFPDHPKFGSSNFWGPATRKGGARVPNGYKLKWRQIGPGRVQLRVCVAILDDLAYLCQGYVKGSQAKDHREAAKLNDRITQIIAGNYTLQSRRLT